MGEKIKIEHEARVTQDKRGDKEDGVYASSLEDRAKVG